MSSDSPPAPPPADRRAEPVDKTYRPEQIEQRWYRRWESLGLFSPRGDGAPCCIMIPPPNVTGTLHMGHAFQITLMDCLIRHRRMSGDKTLWQVGTDHAGIATQMVVERQLEAGGQSRLALGRDAFVEKVWEWKKQSGGMITQQLRRLGASLDWSRERFTMDDDMSRAVREAFVRLYDEGLIYRGKRLVNWDPVLKTAVSDLEVVSNEEDGRLWHIRYPYADGDGHVVVATTRPETLLGDTAAAVHPDDERYRDSIGRRLTLPLTGRVIPLLADDYVQMEFGTGCVKITPAHDFNDYEVGRRHDLPMINLFNDDATLGARAPEAYRGLDRFEARKRVLADLREQGLLEDERPHRHAVPRGDRSHAVIEPYLTDQWFVNARQLAPAACEAVRDGRVRFVPKRWEKTYFEWMDNIQDWCISRQLWWGHRIPAWYDDSGNLYVGDSEQAVRDKHHLGGEVALTQEPDVLDTWFSSALWPFSTLGWPSQTPEMKAFYPTSVLVTGFDIIFFWVARMIMAGLKFTGDVPFHEVYVHGLVRDIEGQKMSKSKGNILDPIDLIDGISPDDLVAKRTASLMQPAMTKRIEQHTRKDFPDGIAAYGTDALRFTFAALASTGRDIKFDMQRIEGYRNFCNKLWNAARFAVMVCPEAPVRDGGAAAGGALPSESGRGAGAAGNVSPSESALGAGAAATLADRWIASRLHRVLEQTERWFREYRFDLIAAAMHEFVWHDFCDWYLEITKIIQDDGGGDGGDGNSANGGGDSARANRACLMDTLEACLRMLHPVIPFITAEIWQQIKPLTGHDEADIQQRPYPLCGDVARDAEAERTMARLQSFVSAIRQVRSEMNVPPGRAVPVLLQNWGDADRALFDDCGGWIARLAGIGQLEWLAADSEAPPAAIALAGQVKILIPAEGLIDIEAETLRLKKEIAKTEKTLAGMRTRLADRNFLDKAPADVIEKQSLQAEHLEGQLDKYHKQLQVFSNTGGQPEQRGAVV